METRTVPKTLNSRVRSSVQPYASEPARHAQPKSSRSRASFLVLPRDAPEASEVDVRAKATGSGRASRVDKPGKPEYLSHNFNDLAACLEQHLDTHRESLGDISHELKAPISRIRLLNMFEPVCRPSKRDVKPF